MLHWALFLQNEQRNVAKSGQTQAISNSVAIRRHVGKVQKHPEHISKGSEFSTEREDNATFSFLHNVELIPENSGDHSGRTPLHVASASGQIAMVQWLLEKGWKYELLIFTVSTKKPGWTSDKDLQKLL